MGNMLKVLIVLLSITLTSCAELGLISPMPNVRFEKYPISNKLDLKVALIINRQLSEFIYQKKDLILPLATGRSCEFDYSLRVAAGSLSEGFFVNGFNNLFVKADVFKDFMEIKNKSDYDYILIPDLAITESIVAKEGFVGFRGTNFTSFTMTVEAYYQLKIKEARDNSEVMTLTGYGKAIDSENLGGCVLDALFDDLIFAYRDVIGNAMKEAFAELLKNAETSLAPLAKAKSGK